MAIEEDGAARQRMLEIDDLMEDVKEAIERSEAEDFQEKYDITWIFHEAGLEGVVLTYPEIKSAVDNKIISDVSLLPTYQDIKNMKWCIDSVRAKSQDRKFKIDIAFVKEMHGRLVGDPELEGIYRKDIPIHRTYFHEIEQPAKIQASLTKALEFLNHPEDDFHPVELAASFHHRFMATFPFSKHSGFIGRTLLNYVLMRYGYLPAIIHATNRQQYYESLRGPEREFQKFLTETMEHSLTNIVKHIEEADTARVG